MTDPTAARLRFTASMLVIPLTVTIAAVAWGLWVLPELPDPMATNFSFDMSAGGFTSPARSSHRRPGRPSPPPWSSAP